MDRLDGSAHDPPTTEELLQSAPEELAPRDRRPITGGLPPDADEPALNEAAERLMRDISELQVRAASRIAAEQEAEQAGGSRLRSLLGRGKRRS